MRFGPPLAPPSCGRSKRSPSEAKEEVMKINRHALREGSIADVRVPLFGMHIAFATDPATYTVDT